MKKRTMTQKDKVAFIVSGLILFLTLIPAVDGGAEVLILWLPVVLYWLYRYFNKDISFIHSNQDED